MYFSSTFRPAALLFALSLMLGCESSARHSVVISGPVHVYPTSTPPATYPGNSFIAELGPNDHPRVLETISGNGYRAAKVKLADGREGWVFSGESVEIK